VPPAAALLLCAIVGITDGDTLTARCESQTIKVRLAEIDAPENGQPFAVRSKQHLSSLCYRQEAEIHPKTRDRYGRTVARVFCAGVDANAAMVQAGMAWAFTRHLTDPMIPRLEAQAKAAHEGLWVDAKPIAPWEWRRRSASGSPLSGSEFTRGADGNF
jgi:endonuclease YncB( thermonuclease family)